MEFKSDYQKLMFKYKKVKRLNHILSRENEDNLIVNIKVKTLVVKLLHAHYECDQSKINDLATKVAKLINPEDWLEYRVKLGYISMEKSKKKERR